MFSFRLWLILLHEKIIFLTKNLHEFPEPEKMGVYEKVMFQNICKMVVRFSLRKQLLNLLVLKFQI